MIPYPPSTTAVLGNMAETRNFDCPLTESRCAEGECSLTHCVRRQRQDSAFRRHQEEKPFFLNVAKILSMEDDPKPGDVPDV